MDEQHLLYDDVVADRFRPDVITDFQDDCVPQHPFMLLLWVQSILQSTHCSFNSMDALQKPYLQERITTLNRIICKQQDKKKKIRKIEGGFRKPHSSVLVASAALSASRFLFDSVFAV